MSNLIGVLVNGNARLLAEKFNEQAYSCNGSQCSPHFRVTRIEEDRFLIMGAEGNAKEIFETLNEEIPKLGIEKLEAKIVKGGWSELSQWPPIESISAPHALSSLA